MISSLDRVKEFVASGNTNPVSLNFPFAAATDLTVTAAGDDGIPAALLLGIHYSIGGTALQWRAGTGTIVPIAIAAGLAVRVERMTSLGQTYDPQAGVALDHKALARTLDDVTMRAIDSAGAVEVLDARALLVPKGQVAPEIVSVAALAGMYLAVNADASRVMGASGTGADAALRGDMGEDDGGEILAFKAPFADTRRRNAQVKMAEQLLTPEDFRQPGDTVLQRLTRFIAALGNGVHGRLDADYVIPSMVTVGWKSKFKLYGMGYTLKLANGAATGYGGSALYFVGCTDFEVIDLIADGNRANRVPAEDAAHVIVVDKCHHWRFTRVQANNGTCDGFLIYGGSDGNGSGPGGDVAIADCPSYWVMDECEALNNWRQGMSIIESQHALVSRGRYGKTTGAWDAHEGPCAGIDLEPDNVPGWPVNRIDFVGFEKVLFDQNDGAGLLITNINGVRNITVRDCVFDRNKKAAIETFGEIVDIINPKISGWNQVDFTANPGAPAKRGAIDVGVGAGRTRIIGAEFSQVVNPVGNANPCIYVHGGAAAGIEIAGIRSDGSASDILVCYAPKANIHDNTVDLTGATAHPHFTVSGANSTFQRNKLIGVNERALYAGGARVRIIDNEFYLRVATEVAWCVQAGDSAYAEVRGNRIELDAAGATYGFQVPVDAILVDNWAYNITTGSAFGLGGTAIFNRGNHFSGVKLAETALAT